MSWDLYVVPPEHAADPGEWIEGLVVEGNAGDPAVAREHARVILEHRPELQATEPGSDGTIEVGTADEEGPPITILLDGLHAEVSAAYWDLGAKTGDMARLLVDVVSALTAHTGWVAFDPQQDEVVSMGELEQAFLREHSEGVELLDQLVEDSKPRRKRLFGLFGD